MARKKTDLSIIDNPGFPESENLPKTNEAGAPDHDIDGLPVKLNDIEFCKYNPREQENPKYDDIKESIRNTGLQQTLVVTKVPGDDNFSLYYGGNTRLKILRELYEETKDKRFYDLRVNYRPFKSVTNLIANHMSENENKGDMIFVDKAKAAAQFRQFYLEEHGVKLSSRKLVEALKEAGWKTSRNAVSLYIYTSDNLVNLIPGTLESGIGSPKVEELRKYGTTIKTYADFLGEDVIAEEAALNEWYAELKDSDDPDLFNAEGCLSRFAYRLSRLVNKTLTEVEAQLLHIIEDGKPYDGSNDYLEKVELPPESSDSPEPADTKPKTSGTSTTSASKTVTESNADTTDNKPTAPESAPTAQTDSDAGVAIPPGGASRDEILINEDQFRTRIHTLIGNFPEDFENLLMPANEKPFFIINEDALSTKNAPKTLSRFTQQKLAQVYIFYRFLRIWILYHKYITGAYTDITLSENGLTKVLGRFSLFCYTDAFLEKCQLSLRSPRNRTLIDNGLPAIANECALLERIMDQFYVQS